MSAILPISTVRVSDALVRTRLTQQVQSDQLDLFRVQNQLSTGRRIFAPSDDAPSALRAITLQRNLERQAQVQLNLAAAVDVLSAAGSGLSETSEVLNNIRGAALGVSGTDATEQQRQVVIDEVDRAIEALLRFGNSTFRDNFLFGGSEGNAQPYTATNTFVEYNGNEETLQSFVDIGLLFDVNVPGQQAFGGISEAVRGSTDLDPQVTTETLLSQLNAGDGVNLNGVFQIDFVPDSPGGVVTESTTINLQAANTLGDVARLIEAGAPAAADLRVALSGRGLSITTNGPIPGGVTISDVGQGSTAADLGIATNVVSNSFTGGDLDPTIRLTTPLDSLLGTRSSALLAFTGANNDLAITANQNGAFVDPSDPLSDPLNGVNIQFIDGGIGTVTTALFEGGDPTAAPAVAPTLTVTIDATEPPTAAEVAAAINAEPSGLFSAATVLTDSTSALETGTGSVDLVATATTAGGSGQFLDLAAGLVIENGEGPVVVDTSTAETVFDLLEALNAPELGLTAQLNATGAGIDVRTRRSGADFAIGENGGTLATQLGLRTFTGESRLEDFNRGVGVLLPQDELEGTITNNEFRISITDAGVTQTFDIDLVGVPAVATDPPNFAQTVDDVIERINTATGGLVEAQLAEQGNGITLTTNTRASADVGLAGDSLTFTANEPGTTGNQDFTVEIVDSGGGGLATTVLGSTITVDLGGAVSTTDAIATSISGQLADFTVVSSGAADVAAPVAQQDVALTGGNGFASVPSEFAVGSFDLAGDTTTDTLTFTADNAGESENQSFEIEFVNSGTGGLAATVTDNFISVDLGGLASSTDDIAAEISAQLAGFTVTSNGSDVVSTTAAVVGGASETFETLDGFDGSAPAADRITVTGAAAGRLGFFAAGSEQAISTSGTIDTDDRNTLEAQSAFNTLFRLRDALEAGDVAAISAEINQLDVDLDRALFAESELGARVQTLETIEIRLQEEEVQIRTALSEEIDVDLAEAISEFTARQFALQASLQATANLLELTLLNFI